MSFEATQAVRKHSKQKRSAFLLLLTIADYVNEKKGGVAWAGVPRLADAARMSERQVQRLTRVLENSGELQVLRQQGPHGTNLYKVCLPKNLVVSVAGDVGDTSGNRGAVPVTPETRIGDTPVTQSLNEPILERTPVVPEGDIGFWIQKCFECFRQQPHPLPTYILKAVERAIPFLEKKEVASLINFYQLEPIDSKEKPFNSRKHSPERLMLHLPEQLALAAQIFPSLPPKKEEPPRWCEFFRWKYPECCLPRSFDELSFELRHEYECEYQHLLAQSKRLLPDEN